MRKRDEQQTMERIIIISGDRDESNDWSTMNPSSVIDDMNQSNDGHENLKEGLLPDGANIDNQAKEAFGHVSIRTNTRVVTKTSKKRERLRTLELNPTRRKRLHNRLLLKLRHTIDELAERAGQQAIVLVASADRPSTNCTVFGTKPLVGVVKSFGSTIMKKLDYSLSHLPSTSDSDDANLFDLPPLLIDGIPTPVELMTQVHLRAFIPRMLKYSTGRSKVGWGKENTCPPWWPEHVPWANIRLDVRNEEAKLETSWNDALREIIFSCYNFHGREDLLPICIPSEDVKTENIAVRPRNDIEPCTSTDFQTITTKSDSFMNVYHLSPDDSLVTLPNNADQEHSFMEATINTEGYIIATEEVSIETKFKRDQLLKVFSLKYETVVTDEISEVEIIPQIKMETITTDS